MMRLIGHDFLDSGNLIQAPHHRHDARDRDLSGEIAGGRIDGGEFYAGPHEVELLHGLAQKLVTVDQHKPLAIVSTQARLENIAEDDSLAAAGGQGNEGGLMPALPVTKDRFFRLFLKWVKNHSQMEFRYACIFVGCGGSRVPLPNRIQSLRARL